MEILITIGAELLLAIINSLIYIIIIIQLLLRSK